MKFTPERYPVKEIVNAWQVGSLVRNADYQRGATWTRQQQQALIDSILRDYPIPPLFLEEKVDPGLGGAATVRWEIVDGQQRVRALSAFCEGAFELLAPEDKRLRLPNSMRGQSVPWARRHFTDLPADLKAKVEQTQLDVYLIRDVPQPDEVRDLFIRLQSGTALTRQQVRDAWPGNLGPYIEGLAGKLGKGPSMPVFQLVDGRGAGVDEEDAKDQYARDRQTCAQVVKLLLARIDDPGSFPSVAASDLDGLYHDYTAIDPDGAAIHHINEILGFTRQVCERLERKPGGKRKMPKLCLIALVMFLHDVTKNPLCKLDARAFGELAHYVTSDDLPKSAGKGTSGKVIQQYYEAWREGLPPGIGVKLDRNRDFSEQQKAEIRRNADGKCDICGLPVDEEAAHYHHETPWRDGGQTVVENGRLVHKDCHPGLGRPSSDE